MKFVIGIILLSLVSGTALADEAARVQKISAIVKAQGVYDQFDELIQQSRGTTDKFLEESYRDILDDLDIPKDKADPRLETAFKRFRERMATLWTADDLLAIWARNYGKNLSDSELDQILAYYQSPIGRKDVAAQQAALVGLSRALVYESKQRLAPHIKEFTNELKAIAAQGQQPKKSSWF